MVRAPAAAPQPLLLQMPHGTAGSTNKSVLESLTGPVCVKLQLWTAQPPLAVLFGHCHQENHVVCVCEVTLVCWAATSPWQWRTWPWLDNHTPENFTAHTNVQFRGTAGRRQCGCPGGTQGIGCWRAHCRTQVMHCANCRQRRIW
eukprot:364837-Chlamydomonas_euryale.AAC.3